MVQLKRDALRLLDHIGGRGRRTKVIDDRVNGRLSSRGRNARAHHLVKHLVDGNVDVVRKPLKISALSCQK